MSGHRQRPARHRAMLTSVAALLAACGTSSPTPPKLQNQSGGPPPVRVATNSAANQMVPLGNGLMTYLECAPRGSEAQVQFAVLAGSVFVSSGLAELAATVLVESSDPASGRASLRHRIEALGGSIQVNLGLMTTWFDIRISEQRMPAAILALREALDFVTQSRSQIERMRSELVNALSAEIQTNPIPKVASLLLHAERGTGSYLNALLDLDPSQVSLFFSRLYRPDRCLLAIATPQDLPDAVKTVRANEAIAGWQPAPPVPGPIPVIERNFQPGLYWAEVAGRPNQVRAAYVLRLPDPTVVGSAEWLAMHSCLTLGGRGGRLERMQDEAGLAHIDWQVQVEQTPDAMALVMSAIVDHDEAASLWRVLNRARQSLVEVPPTPSELQLALRRAQLIAGFPSLSSSDRLRLAANIKTRDVAPDGIMDRLLQMADTSTWDLRKAAAAFQETPAWMIVVGAGRPDDLPGVVPFDLLPEGFAATVSEQPSPTAIAATGPWLVRARAAMGGGENFSQLQGFTASGKIVGDKSPDATDQISWEQSGKLSRKRQILTQTITTELDGNSGSETLDSVRQSLDLRETRLLRHEMMRQPLMLLAANASGALQFRPIAQRSSGDREFMVLEAIGDEFDRLRIHIDTESYLIRIVESWERLPDETLVHVRETWSDYRAAGPMRAPHRCRTTWNDGEHQTEMVFSEWQPKMTH